MTTVYKYQLRIGAPTKIKLPRGAIILCFKIQNEIPCIWCLVDMEQTSSDLEWFIIKGTGHEIGDDLKLEYIGTDFSEGSFVWHCFKVL